MVVPNTGHMKGIPAAVAAGIVAGKADKKLEVLGEVSLEDRSRISTYLEKTPIEIQHIEKGHLLDIIMTVFKKDAYARVRIVDAHTNVVFIEKNEEVIYQKDLSREHEEDPDKDILTVRRIWDFAMGVDLDDVKDLLERQITFNCSIAREGLEGDYGANIGKVLLSSSAEKDVLIRAKAKAAAGSDARMNGCEMPVIINSGSGNQGITCTVPVVEYARELGVPQEQLLRALVISNLTAIHAKRDIGTLSAFCGAVTAAIGAAAGVSYLLGGGFSEYKHTISNGMAISTGMVCDGAKASCAAKIAVSLDSALLACHMYSEGNEFKRGEGLITSDVENTITNIGRLGREGMRQTNETIIDMMLDNE